MGFDLYFAGAVYSECMEYCKEKNACKLFTQMGERNEINKWVQEKKEGKITNKIFVDSGAYTAHTKLKEVDVDEYIAYVNSISEYIDVFAQVDKIPGQFRKPRTTEEIKKAPELSWQNYLYMRDRVKEPDKLIPIFHQDEHFDWLENMLEWKDINYKHIPYIGISSSKDKAPKDRYEWYKDVFTIIRASSNPKVKTHSFGTSSINHINAFPFYSSDATSWIRCAANGNIMTEFGTILVSGRQQFEPDHINSKKTSKKALAEYVKSFGFDLEKLIHDTETSKANIERLNFNIAFLQDFADKFETSKINSFKKGGLF